MALYERELQFLCDTFRRNHVSAMILSCHDPILSLLPAGWNSVFGGVIDPDLTVSRFLGTLLPQTLYRASDNLGLSYLYLLLPSMEDEVLFLGPYRSAPVSSGQMWELGEQMRVPPKAQSYFGEYLGAIPVLPEGSPLFTMLNVFCERLWTNASFAVVDVNREQSLPASPLSESSRSDELGDILVNMRSMEQRYSFENELIRAVVHGQIHKEHQFFSFFSEQTFEKRTADPLRNAKNYDIIMNTLLRKAAEEGGVHPVYLDRVSSGFALKIEQLSVLSENSALMREMFRSYCRLVRKHSMKSLSLPVQKTILLIDSDLSANLTLRTLAQQQNVSAGYLATLFKRETGKTVTEYIRERRMKHAMHLLTTTGLQIQTVALHCGVMDVQYFSKMFKRQTGMTPWEYRESMR